MELLKKLIYAFGVPGFEEEIRELVAEHMEKYLDEVRVDRLGNVIGVKKGNERKVMLAAHMDQIGFMVKNITEDGFLLISPMGGIKPSTLRSQAVRIKGKEGYVYGVIGEKPPHLEEKKEEKKEIKDLRLDIGVDSKEKAEKLVSIGDVGSFVPNFYELEQRVVATALDDRSGVYTLLRVMENFESEATVYFVSTVQEEIGVRGAMVSSFGVYPDIGIAIDVTHARMPSMSKDDISVELGKGPTIGIGPTGHPNVVRYLMEIAGVPYQVEPNPSHSGTDADVIQLTREGVATAVISIPLRYMHSSVEMADKMDLYNTVKLIRNGLSEIHRVELRL